MTQSLAAPTRFELDVRKSRFIAQAAPVDAPDSALAWIASASDPEATHNCWAWRIGSHYRFFDDGEPSGTAGKPILAAIDGQGLDGVVALVTRWFGGIKLGAGGLVRAYGGCAAECLRRAERIECIALCEMTLAFEFEHAGVVHTLLARHAAEKLQEDFVPDGVHLRLRLPTHALDALRTALRDATRGRAILRDPELPCRSGS